MPQSILMIGYGAIAGYVARKLEADADGPRLRWVLVRPGRENRARAAVGENVELITDVSQVTDRIDYAVECAGHGALRDHGEAILRRGIDLGIVSIGAFSDADLAASLESAAQAGEAQIDILSGAIGGLDALAAARVEGLDRVTYISRKPPQSWKGSPAERQIDLDNLSEATAHFEGSARDAARLYPKNANVAATISLAGLGLDQTEVRLIADPGVSGNRHEIEAVGAFGRMALVMEGKAMPGNPKSSALTAMSVVHAIRRRGAYMRI
ncbi:MAG: aspartate dehydrogenase [Fimbriimonadaceae bacterium]|nr:aspartate dehydrogenase [Alphaproteobacteria bacterium]